MLFGGRNSAGVLGDTWEFDGTVWQSLAPAQSPSPRCSHAMAWNAARQRVILSGGRAPDSMFDTWEWDGVTWTPAAPLPVASASHGMGFDAHRGVMMTFGGASWNGGVGQYLTTTAEFDGASWAALQPLRSPSAGSAVMSYEPTRQRLVLVGESADFWVYVP